MRSAVIIQARMSSTRLPGKVLKFVNGMPLLEYLLMAISQSKVINHVIVATSKHPSDDMVVSFCEKKKIDFIRGDLNNVASRFKEVIEHFNLDFFVRISADSPLFDFRILDHAVQIFKKGKFDLVTNVLKRTFPKGQSVEVMSASIFLSNFDRLVDPIDCEHVTPFFYKNKSEFLIHNFEALGDFSHVRLCVDTKDDLEKISGFISKLQHPHWKYRWEDIIPFLGNQD